jgi:hypothetical protein
VPQAFVEYRARITELRSLTDLLDGHRRLIGLITEVVVNPYIRTASVHLPRWPEIL